MTLLIFHIDVLHDFYDGSITKDNWWFKKFNFNKEKNFPTIYSVILLFTSSIFLMLTFLKVKKIAATNYFWLILSLVFLFLSFDELLRIHEKIGNGIKNVIPDTGIFFYAWLIPYLLLLIVLAIYVIKPLFKLPKETFYGFIVSGIIFVGGAVGMEMVSGNFIKNSSLPQREAEESYDVFIFYTIEESLEMIGVICFLYFIFQYYYSLNNRKTINIS